jgi:hypothetical protein
MKSYFGGSHFGYKAMFMILYKAPSFFFVLIFTMLEIVCVTDARTYSIKYDQNESCGS